MNDLIFTEIDKGSCGKLYKEISFKSIKCRI